MRTLGIDASNIKVGGGQRHLVEFLRAANPRAYCFDEVIVWGGSATLSKIENRDWLRKRHEPLLDRALGWRVFWQKYRLRRLAREAKCDVLFVPGGSDASGVRPMVTMNQNLLPFDWMAIRRRGWSLATLKWTVLRWTQTRTFRRADAVIYLTEYARETVARVTGDVTGASAVIPHGINPRFFRAPRPQRAATEFTDAMPCHLLYVSFVDVYKHHPEVVQAAALLRSQGLPVTLELIGAPGAGISSLRHTLQELDPAGAFVKYRGTIPHDQLPEIYAAADIGIFASSCETFGQILTEAMGAGLPIACSSRSAMPEILGDAGLYFDPERPAEIAATIRQLIESPQLRAEKAQAAFSKAQVYSWERCADETLALLARVRDQHKAKRLESGARAANQ